jgi:hypothetical protein
METNHNTQGPRAQFMAECPVCHDGLSVFEKVSPTEAECGSCGSHVAVAELVSPEAEVDADFAAAYAAEPRCGYCGTWGHSADECPDAPTDEELAVMADEHDDWK